MHAVKNTRDSISAKVALLVLLLLAAAMLTMPGCQSPQPTQSALTLPTQQTPKTEKTPQSTPPMPKQLQVEVVASNLDIPWSLVFAPDGRLFFTERPGQIMVMEPGGQPRLFATVDVATIGEGGLLGMALSPAFSQDHYFYLYHTYKDRAALKNRVVRYTEQGNGASNPTTILDNIPAGVIHDGGRLRFGPDGKLYITAGDASQSQSAQDVRSLSGKILRINPDGSIPSDNPFPNSPVYSLGNRNPQGLDWNPANGKLYETEHGPVAHDEVNLISPGGNYGWPNIVGIGNDPRYLNPLTESGSDTWAPSGATFYRGSRLIGWQGSFFFAALRGEALHRLTFKGPALTDITDIDVHQVLLSGVYGRLRDVVEGPDGSLYLATSNRDGRGSPSAEDDRIVRVAPGT